MMKIRRLTIIILGLSLFVACKQQNKKTVDAAFDRWYGKEILFPEKSVFTRLLTDTTIFDYSKFNMKILIYADTTECMGCKLQLNRWKEFMISVGAATSDTIPFLFFIYPKDIEEMRYLIQSENFDYPVCVDSDDLLNKLNKFSSDVSFLLDENNHVIVAGNPILDLETRDLYMEKIAGKKAFNNSIKTTVNTEQTIFDLGTFDKTDIKEVFVKIRNTGNNPLVIFDVNTSCGCITTSFDKQPVNPGNNIVVKLKIIPNETGFLSKVVKISGNFDKPIVINVQGNITDL